LRNDSGKWNRDEHGGHSLFYRKVPYSGVVVLLGDEEQLLGVAGLEKVEPAAKLLTSLRK
jgi:hypothetical protein